MIYIASCNFQNSKSKGATAAKMRLRHCSKEGRAAAKKRNKHINLEKTKDNFSVFGLSYKQCCDKYDKRIAEIDANGNTNKRKDRVTMVSIEIPAPADLPEEQCEKWFNRVSDIVIDFFGGPENLIEGFIHVDEVHDYINAETGESVRSRVHGHFCGIPEFHGNLNGKKVTSRKNIIKINERIDTMSRKEFGCAFLTGMKKKSFHTVEELKEMSAYAEYEIEVANREEELKKQQEQLQAHKAALERREREIEAAEENAQKLQEEAKEIYREAVRREQEALENIQNAENSADQSRRNIPELDAMEERWRREHMIPAPTADQILDELREIRRRRSAMDDDTVEMDAAQEAQAEENQAEEEYRIPFIFRGFVPNPPVDEDEVEEELEF